MAGAAQMDGKYKKDFKACKHRIALEELKITAARLPISSQESPEYNENMAKRA